MGVVRKENRNQKMLKMTSEAPQNPYFVRLYCEEIDVTLTSITFVFKSCKENYIY